jgi:hypothetical protein
MRFISPALFPEETERTFTNINISAKYGFSGCTGPAFRTCILMAVKFPRSETEIVSSTGFNPLSRKIVPAVVLAHC